MGLIRVWRSIFLAVIVVSSSNSSVLRDGFESSMIVKREAVDADSGSAGTSMPADTEVTEPEILASVAASDASLLDIFSTSTKEKKPLRAVIQSVYATSNVTFRYGKTRIESKILNPAEVAQEVFFDVILPETAFISGFSMEIDGKVYEAYVKEKQEAQKVYDTAIKQGITAGQVKQSVRDSNRFSVSVNVEPMKKVKFNLTYEELLQRTFGVYRHVINLNPGQIVEDLSVDVFIKENREITTLRVPEFQAGNEVYPSLEIGDFDLAKVERISPTEVKVSFKPTVEDQKKLQKRIKRDVSDSVEGISGQFAVEYDVDRDANGGDILVNDGYFVHFFAPKELPPLKKHIIFVLDVSGSMDGRKIEQLKQAMSAILSELNPTDYFNIVEFSFSVTVRDLDSPSYTPVRNPWVMMTEENNITTVLPKPFPATPLYIEKGKEVVQNMTAAGGTNINAALNTAIELAKNGLKNSEIGAMKDESKSDLQGETNEKYMPPEPMIIFLTDGEPTVGQTSESAILKNVDEKNDPRVPIFSLAFGTDADFGLLKKISLLSNGFARQIYEAADTSLQLRNFYRQISSPTLSNVRFVYPPEQVKSETITKINFSNFFGGSELVVSGKLKEETSELDLGHVEAQSLDGVRNYPVIHIDRRLPKIPTEKNYRPLERLWVYMTIKKLLDEADLEKARSYKHNYEENLKPLEPRPEDEALRLALEAVQNAVYSFVRKIIDCLTTKLKLLQSLFANNDFVYVDLKNEAKPKNLSEIITELAVKYSFVCPLTSLVVVKPGGLTDANVEPATASKGLNKFGLFSPAVALGFGLPDSISRVGLPLLPSVSAQSAVPYSPKPGYGALSTTFKSVTFAQEPEPAKNSTNLTLDSITWLDQTLNGDVLHFPGDPESVEYILGRNQTDDFHGNCNISNGSISGVCRHLEHCVLEEILSDVNYYHSNYFCVIPGYAATLWKISRVSTFIRHPERPTLFNRTERINYECGPSSNYAGICCPRKGD